MSYWREVGGRGDESDGVYSDETFFPEQEGLHSPLRNLCRPASAKMVSEIATQDRTHANPSKDNRC